MAKIHRFMNFFHSNMQANFDTYLRPLEIADVLYGCPLSHSFFANECKFRLEDRVIFLPKIQISVTFDVCLMIVFLAKITHFSNRLIFVRVYNKASPKVNLTKSCGYQENYHQAHIESNANLNFWQKNHMIFKAKFAFICKEKNHTLFQSFNLCTCL